MPSASQEWRMGVLETIGSGSVTASRCRYRQALLKIDVRSLQEFFLVRIDEGEAVLGISFDIETSSVAVTILILPTGETQSCCVELIPDAEVIAGRR